MGDTGTPYFSIAGSSSLVNVPKGSLIHVMGVAGVAMAQLAIELTRLGFRVTGSDKEFYDPMGTLLRESSVVLFQGYDAQPITREVSLVVIGNAISRGNPQLEEVQRLEIPYTFFPKALFESIISGHHSIVVSGTHGKTTSTALGACVMQGAGLEPSFFIGGRVPQLETSLMWGQGDFSIVEGDEYDSAFFAKVPKFSFYRPNTLLVTSVEFDHADIYPDIHAIEVEFDRVVSGMPVGSTVVACDQGGKSLSALSNKWRTYQHITLLSYGVEPHSEYRIVTRNLLPNGGQEVVVAVEDQQFSIPLRINGFHNALNAVGIFAALNSAGISADRLMPHFASFEGVSRRQECIWSGGGIQVFEDFAHHPTAVRETIASFREQFPDKRIVVLFEPRSNTSRRATFQLPYEESLAGADVAIVSSVQRRENDKDQQILDTTALVESLLARGHQAIEGADPDDILQKLLNIIAENDVVVLMSNGGFGGIPQKLPLLLTARQSSAGGSVDMSGHKSYSERG